MLLSTKNLFLLLVISQSLHSLEEFWFRLWEVFEPARVVSSFFSDDPVIGFLVANTLIVAFGFWCYFWPVRGSWKSAQLLTWFWVLLSLGNSVGHTFFAVARSGYFPGIYTAPLLFVFSGLLLMKLLRSQHEISVT